MKNLLIILISFLLLSSPVIGNSHKGETLYRWGKYPYVWKGFGDKETHPIYKGDVENGKPSGLGFLIFPKKGRNTKGLKKYVGSWKNGKYNGEGTFTRSNGGEYFGEWKDGKEWNGRLYHKNGKILFTFVNGKGKEHNPLSTNLQAVEFYTKKGKLSLNLGKNWVQTSNIRLNKVNETFKKNNISLKFVDGFYYKLNHDVYIWIQVIKGDYEPDEMIKLLNIDEFTTKIEDKYSKKVKNINKQISSLKLGKTIWSDEHKAAIMKVHVKRGNNADLNGLSHFFFLENQITAIHCYSPSNFDQSKYYYDAMKTVAIDDNYVKDDNWYKILYGILGLKYLKKLK